MGEDSQNFPLAHYQAYQKSDEEIATIKALKKERNNKCFIYVFSAFVLLSVLALIFALIVLRVNSPTLQVSSVSIGNLNYANTNSSSPSFNFTLIAEIAVRNSNFGPFDYENGTVGLIYGGVIVGKKHTGGGTAGAKGRKRMNLRVEARSNHGVLEARNVSSDLNSGVLKLRSFVKLRGTVRLIQIFKKKMTAEINCSMNLYLNTRRIQDLACE